MATLRVVRRGRRTYYYVHHSYRWEGKVRQRDQYLGTKPPAKLQEARLAVERSTWADTWFREFERIKVRLAEHNAAVPSRVAEKERASFVIDFTYDTNRIEGSTLTLREVADLLRHGTSPSSKPVADVLEARAHASLVGELLARPQPLDLPHLLAWHKALFSQTALGIAGNIRTYGVEIGQSRHRPPAAREVGPMLHELFRWHNTEAESLHPVEHAAAFHFRFESIHPFGDGNGRVGRIAMNVILQQHGFPMMNIRYGKRRGYYHALERSNLTKDERPFLLWFFRRYLHEQGRLLGG
jgi:Fic family protein